MYVTSRLLYAFYSYINNIKANICISKVTSDTQIMFNHIYNVTTYTYIANKRVVIYNFSHKRVGAGLPENPLNLLLLSDSTENKCIILVWLFCFYDLFLCFYSKVCAGMHKKGSVKISYTVKIEITCIFRWL